MTRTVPWWKRWWTHSNRLPPVRPAEDSLASVLAVSQAVATSLELDQVLETVHQQVSLLYDTTNFYVATYEQSSDDWTTVLEIERGQRQPATRHKVGAGLTGYVIRSCRPLLLRTAQESAAFCRQQGVQIIGEPGKSWLGVPLIATGQVVGVMAIQSYEQENLYGEQDLAFFSTLADQVAGAIRNARLYQETSRRAEEMALLLEVNQTLGTALSLRETLESLIQGLRRLVPHEGGEVSLYDPERKVFTTEAVLGETGQDASAESYTLDEGYTGWIGRHRQPLLIGDCASFSDARPRREEVIRDGRLRSYLGVPMLVGERLVGALELVSGTLNAFSQDHLRLLTLVASQAAAAIERARLFEELSRRLQEARLLFQVSQGIASTLSLEEVLEMTIQACVQAIPAAEKGALHLLDEEKQELRPRAAVGYSERTMEVVRIKVGQPYGGQVVQTGEPMILDDVRSTLRGFRTGLPEIEEIRSSISVPLRVRDRIIGVISLDNVHATAAFRQQDVEVLSAFAGQAAIAIENARLYEQLRGQVGRLSQLAEQVRQASGEAQALVQSSSSAVAALGERSRAIGQFVAQLEQFADQTDLLALNAAIEAARAGEHGLGFAVVADEVRRLAESSTQAAREVAALSQEIIAETGKAVQQMEQARRAVEHTAQLARGVGAGGPADRGGANP